MILIRQAHDWYKNPVFPTNLFYIILFYLFIWSNMIEHKTILLKQLHEQDNKAVINSADSCPN